MHADPAPAPTALILDILYAMGAVAGYGRSIPTPRLCRLLECARGRPVSARTLLEWGRTLVARGRVETDWTRSRVDPLRYTRVGAQCRGYRYVLAPGEAPPTPGL